MLITPSTKKFGCPGNFRSTLKPANQNIESSPLNTYILSLIYICVILFPSSFTGYAEADGGGVKHANYFRKCAKETTVY